MSVNDLPIPIPTYTLTRYIFQHSTLLTYKFLNKKFQEIKLFICHCFFITFRAQTRSWDYGSWDFYKQFIQASRLSWMKTEVFHWKLKCSIELLFIFVRFSYSLLPIQEICSVLVGNSCPEYRGILPLEWSLFVCLHFLSCLAICIRGLEEFYYCDQTWCIVIFFSVNLPLLACWASFSISGVFARYFFLII